MIFTRTCDTTVTMHVHALLLDNCSCQIPKCNKVIINNLEILHPEWNIQIDVSLIILKYLITIVTFI